MGVNVLITTVLIPRSTILIIGKMLRAAPNTVQRHFETLRDASARATRIRDADGIPVFGAMRDVRIETRDFLAPLFYILETLSARNTH
ncbi:MAG: hypothetical protein OXD49_04205 [Candidatus Poribacteria bacterium]|nr:hypothetical protein [Candidatus Poribacteria bacterium]